MLYCICMCYIMYFHISFICSCTTDKLQTMVTSGVTELGPRDSYTLLLNIAWPNTHAVRVEQRWKKSFAMILWNNEQTRHTDSRYNTRTKKRIQRAFFVRYCVITITIISLIDFLWIITYTSNPFFFLQKSRSLEVYPYMFNFTKVFLALQ